LSKKEGLGDFWETEAFIGRWFMKIKPLGEA